MGDRVLKEWKHKDAPCPLTHGALAAELLDLMFID